MRIKRMAVSAFALVLGFTGVTLASSTPAHAVVCGDTANSWVPALGSIWDLDLVINGNGYTGLATFTQLGDEAVTVVVDLGNPGNLLLLGNFDYEGSSTFAWSATSLSPEYRLTLRGVADECGLNGRVTNASGAINDQTSAIVGNFLMARVV